MTAELFVIGDTVKANEYAATYYYSEALIKGDSWPNSDKNRRNLTSGRVVDIFVAPGDDFLTIQIEAQAGTLYMHADTLTHADPYIIDELPYTPDQQEG